ncbi:MAG: hypothetical protein J7641_14225 [Cyanobacteria bacterium SID2]|nr:hypothetical protein [Cyanobacteria bacterium SID2]MBP0002913.1 hypothetical protein [Cyanobacteria bacterium SBC]
MSSNPGKLLEQAKQGDPQAIAALMNRSTQPKGISVKATLKDRCLQVLLEGSNVPKQKKTVDFVREGMLKLEIDSIERVKVYGRQVGQEHPVWQQEIVLKDDFPESLPSSTPPDLAHQAVPVDELASESLLPNDLLEGRPGEGADLSEMDFPEAPPDAEAFLNEGLGEEYAEDYAEEEYGDDREDLEPEGEGFEEESMERFDEFEDAEDAEADEPDPSTKPKSSLGLLLGLLVIVVLCGGGYYLYTTRPGLFSAIPFLDRGNGTTPETPASEGTEADVPTAETVEEEPTPEPTNPFSDAVKAAENAATKAQTAQTPEQWQEVAQSWRAAADNMKAVPQDHPQYNLAQQKAQEYQKNFEYAQKQAQ